jgi:hypothetical protein
VLLSGVVVTLPELELLVVLFTLERFVTADGRSLLPELLFTSGLYILTVLLSTVALPALPEFVTLLSLTLLPVSRSMSRLLGPL